ncbi:MAG: hypothetical protein ACKVQC_04860, partial [Elusimicrobiota bacterium]
MNLKTKNLKGLTSLFVSIIYFSTQVALGSLAEANIWEDRKKGTQQQLAQLPGQSSSFIPQLPRTEVISQTIGKNLTSFENINVPSPLTNLMKAVPLHKAQVRDIYWPKESAANTIPVVLIQDVHLNSEAQFNEIAVIESLMKNNQLGVFGVEGAWKKFDFTPYQVAVDQNLKRELAESFVKEKLMGAASFVGISNNPVPPIIGIDHAEHYRNNVEAYQKSQKNKSFTKEKLSQFKKEFQSIKNNQLSDGVKKLENFRDHYHEGKMGFAQYLEKLSQLDNNMDLHIEQFLQAYQMEKSLDFRRIEQERATVVNALAGKLSKTELEELLKGSVAYQSGQMGFGAYYRYLKDLCDKKAIHLTQFKHFDNYIRYVFLSDGIKVDSLFQSVEKTERQLIQTLSRDANDKKIAQTSEYLRLAEKLIEFELTPEEWKLYQEMKDSSSPNVLIETLNSFEDFYRSADIRSQEMLKNVLQVKTNRPRVILTGGFHSRDIMFLLKQKKIPYLVVSPRLTKIDDLAGSDYLSVFDRDKTPLEEIFSGERLFVIPEKQLPGGSDAAASTQYGFLALLAAIPSMAVGQETIPVTLTTQTGNIAAVVTSLAVLAGVLLTIPFRGKTYRLAIDQTTRTNYTLGNYLGRGFRKVMQMLTGRFALVAFLSMLYVLLEDNQLQASIIGSSEKVVRALLRPEAIAFYAVLLVIAIYFLVKSIARKTNSQNVSQEDFLKGLLRPYDYNPMFGAKAAGTPAVSVTNPSSKGTQAVIPVQAGIQALNPLQNMVQDLDPGLRRDDGLGKNDGPQVKVAPKNVESRMQLDKSSRILVTEANKDGLPDQIAQPVIPESVSLPVGQQAGRESTTPELGSPTKASGDDNFQPIDVDSKSSDDLDLTGWAIDVRSPQKIESNTVDPVAHWLRSLGDDDSSALAPIDLQDPSPIVVNFSKSLVEQGTYRTPEKEKPYDLNALVTNSGVDVSPKEENSPAGKTKEPTAPLPFFDRLWGRVIDFADTVQDKVVGFFEDKKEASKPSLGQNIELENRLAADGKPFSANPTAINGVPDFTTLVGNASDNLPGVPNEQTGAFEVNIFNTAGFGPNDRIAVTINEGGESFIGNPASAQSFVEVMPVSFFNNPKATLAVPEGVDAHGIQFSAFTINPDGSIVSKVFPNPFIELIPKTEPSPDANVIAVNGLGIDLKGKDGFPIRQILPRGSPDEDGMKVQIPFLNDGKEYFARVLRIKRGEDGKAVVLSVTELLSEKNYLDGYILKRDDADLAGVIIYTKDASGNLVRVDDLGNNLPINVDSIKLGNLTPLDTPARLLTPLSETRLDTLFAIRPEAQGLGTGVQIEADFSNQATYVRVIERSQDDTVIGTRLIPSRDIVGGILKVSLLLDTKTVAVSQVDKDGNPINFTPATGWATFKPLSPSETENMRSSPFGPAKVVIDNEEVERQDLLYASVPVELAVQGGVMRVQLPQIPNASNRQLRVFVVRADGSIEATNLISANTDTFVQGIPVQFDPGITGVLVGLEDLNGRGIPFATPTGWVDFFDTVSVGSPLYVATQLNPAKIEVGPNAPSVRHTLFANIPNVIGQPNKARVQIPALPTENALIRITQKLADGRLVTTDLIDVESIPDYKSGIKMNVHPEAVSMTVQLLNKDGSVKEFDLTSGIVLFDATLTGLQNFNPVAQLSPAGEETGEIGPDGNPIIIIRNDQLYAARPIGTQNINHVQIFIPGITQMGFIRVTQEAVINGVKVNLGTKVLNTSNLSYENGFFVELDPRATGLIVSGLESNGNRKVFTIKTGEVVFVNAPAG